VRLYLASHHYRSDWAFRWEGLDRATALAARIQNLVGVRRGAGAGPGGAGPGGGRPDLVRKFTTAMDDDLDTSAALRVLRQAVRERDAAGAGWMLGVLAGSASLER